MCGIYGAVVSEQDAGRVVYQGLKRLEYRGYDSWGVVVTKADDFFMEKQVGKIDQNHQLGLPETSISIGHTRWATHGGVTQVNAHPHLAKNGSFALVQNGVVENYQQLRAESIEQGYEFESETDTEVIVALIEQLMTHKKELQPSLITLREAFSKLGGRNTISLVTKSKSIMAIRQGSPLIIGRNKQGEVFISSDVISLATDADEYLMLDHGQGVVITDKKVQPFIADTGEEFAPDYQPIKVASVGFDKKGFADFMLKEIYEQSTVFNNVTQQPLDQLLELTTEINQANRVYVLGAGSASFAAGQIAFWLREQGIQATVLKSYEARSYRKLFSDHDLCIAISQSGETADTNEVVEWLRQSGVKIASIVNMPGSTLTAFSDLPFMLQVGSEVGVASTKALSGQMVWGKLVSDLIAGQTLADYQKQVKAYSAQLKTWFDGSAAKQLKFLAQELIKKDRLFVLGRGQLYMPALEFALKLKEISYIHAEGFSGGELKHGVIALIEKGTPVVCLVAEDEEKNDMLSAAAEVKARGARVIGVAAENNQLFDDWIKIPDNQEFIAISSFLPAQLLTYYMAVEQGYDPDKPRNLAKSVTVK
ncbi:MAG: glutamine--fructose-6-phosphate transaminase (isomerizing) [Candidatus Pacebacteria bacterium]|jgi:glutamine---fructose-6-phosphate transaminase (isomerizing)|nr:glutamine--fructose-6-phosphate transaminase (isomerizing) [Candidatus Paceibacterota bacterium]MBT3511981.1 glutamine--fructose-6-phosphate transaminase (isomerizing) [Candidatus Paceibacterota bacterium]MBT4005303.1 glutamine--fructose-6-phosphate transaminase (isomerizing) [Candidatus Paceibacterota bacterium]MBT4358522.1 glutamine--fructose-6-phosphate transaminase (isomerizing) [Candidatus Paceibacterota bacterium]MBT6898659.1 glutamine--fructose-6-phosphate transaminase (isomerizing) [